MNSKYVYRIILGLIVAAFIFSVVDYFSYSNRMQSESRELGAQLNSQLTNELVSLLDSAEQMGDSLAVHFSKRMSPAMIEREIRLASNKLDYVLGVTVAYLPEYAPVFSPKGYARVYDKSIGELIKIEEIYDYTSDTVSSATWFTSAIESEEALWVEPYFAEDFKKLVTDYAMPITDNINGQKTNIGVVTMTIAVDELRRKSNTIISGKTGYSAIAGPSGRLISHPNVELVLKGTIQQVAKNIDREEEGEKLMQEDSGLFEFTSLYTSEPSFLFFNTMAKNGWKVFTVYSKRDFLSKFDKIKRKTVHLIVFSSLLLVTGMFGFFSFDGLNYRESWIISGTVSIALVGNIIAIWILNLELEQPVKDTDLVEITNSSVLNHYLDNERNILSQIGTKELKTIPTGIYIEELNFVDSYTINVSGRIWQKFPKGSDSEINPGVRFPQLSPFAESAYLEETGTKEFDDYILHNWEFRNTLRMGFDYSKYPFDQRKVAIKLQHPDYLDQILLIPDLDSYLIINPIERPGINPNVSLTNGNIVLSKFSFSANNPRNNFGIENYDGLSEFPTLQLNILVQRNFLNSFIADVIPVIVVAMLVFLVVFSGSSRESSLSGISSLGAIEIAAAFFFVLLLAHIDMRGKILTTDITYIEVFYFIMYFMLGIVAMNIVYFTRSSPKSAVRKSDNLTFKLSYWPILLGAFFLITLVKFY